MMLMLILKLIVMFEMVLLVKMTLMMMILTTLRILMFEMVLLVKMRLMMIDNPYDDDIDHPNDNDVLQAGKPDLLVLALQEVKSQPQNLLAGLASWLLLLLLTDPV